MKKIYFILCILAFLSVEGCRTYSIQVVDSNLEPISDVIVAQPHFNWPFGGGGTNFYKTNNRGCVILKHWGPTILGKKDYFPTMIHIESGSPKNMRVRLYSVTEVNNKEFWSIDTDARLIDYPKLSPKALAEEWIKYREYLNQFPSIKVYQVYPK